jgi:NADH-quinone oxidoreductase subunit E
MSELTDDMKAKIREHFGHYPTKQAITLPALHMVQDAKRCVSNKAKKCTIPKWDF